MNPVKEDPLTNKQYQRMADDLEAMAESIRLRPEMNHHFADRLALLAKQMREDQSRVYSGQNQPVSVT